MLGEASERVGAVAPANDENEAERFTDKREPDRFEMKLH